MEDYVADTKYKVDVAADAEDVAEEKKSKFDVTT